MWPFYLPYGVPNYSPSPAQPGSSSDCQSRDLLSPWSPLQFLGQKQINLEVRVQVRDMIILVHVCYSAGSENVTGASRKGFSLPLEGNEAGDVKRALMETSRKGALLCVDSLS